MRNLKTSLVFFLAFNCSLFTFGSDASSPDAACKPEGEKTTCADAHSSHPKDHTQVLNSLFPEKQKDPQLGQRPSLVEIKSPVFLASVGVGSVKLEWSQIDGASDYHVQVATDPNFKWLVANEKFVKTNSFEFAKAEAGKKYFWRVAAFKADNTAGFTKSNFVSSAFNVK